MRVSVPGREVNRLQLALSLARCTAAREAVAWHPEVFINTLKTESGLGSAAAGLVKCCKML